ncbi:MAG: MHS family MFS transporter [Myxococcales bacterium]|nr:MHS family MFS transporter [Myxococcales bacterium]MBL0197198.1 MHS family MFS transporter [Myxococcales bacterium]HQY61468.1 MFS transporter [Polyangiaceae bacterium]
MSPAESAESAAPVAPAELSRIRQVIFASSVGTLFEWYDFYLYGSLAAFFGGLFFPKGNETAGFLASLATFGAGFAVRPFGAVVFGRLGDRLGRKYTFLVTIVIMGLSTALIGVLPTYATFGMAAPILLVSLRLLQGLALGGEYGGAATYVAEHAPLAKRGYYTSYIQTTATIGFFVSLAVILVSRLAFGDATFKAWGWRVPFLLSSALLAVSVYVRTRLEESPVFAEMKREGKLSANPIKESFTNPLNLKYVLIALFGAAAGQGVVWYTGQFYALYFLQNTLHVDFVTSTVDIAISLALGTPLFVYFGRLSDTVGRKRIMMAGLLLAALTYVPIYMGLRHFANPDLVAHPDPKQMNHVAIVALLTLQVAYVTMVYGPIAAFLVELFPAKIRYTSMSLPYHLGNGWFGGFLPLIASSLTVATGNIYAGLAYPIVVALLTFVVGMLTIREGKQHDVHVIDEDVSP